MKRLLKFLPLLSLFLLSCHIQKKEETKTTNAETNPDNGVVITKTESGAVDTVKKSIKANVKNQIGSANFSITYHSPAVRSRIVWGGLVPYDQVWVTGAHMATSIESDKDFIINRIKISSGKYALFTIPGKEDWTIILNKNWNQHLADEYEAKEDILRMKIKPDSLSYVQERLMYDINQWAQKEGDILILWEKLKLKIPVRIAD